MCRAVSRCVIVSSPLTYRAFLPGNLFASIQDQHHQRHRGLQIYGTKNVLQFLFIFAHKGLTCPYMQYEAKEEKHPRCDINLFVQTVLSRVPCHVPHSHVHKVNTYILIQQVMIMLSRHAHMRNSSSRICSCPCFLCMT